MDGAIKPPERPKTYSLDRANALDVVGLYGVCGEVQNRIRSLDGIYRANLDTVAS